MNPPRFTIAGIMGMVVLAAGVIALLRYSNEECAGIAWTASAAVMVLAAMQARFGPADRRDWWFGFAVFGLATLMVGQDSDWPIHWLNAPLVMRLPLPSDISIPGLESAQHLFYLNAMMILIAAESLVAGWIGGFVAEAASRRARRRDVEHEPVD